MAFRGLLELLGVWLSSPVGGPPPGPGPDPSGTQGQEVLELLAPDGTVLGQLTKYADFEAVRAQFGLGSLAVTLHFEDELIHAPIVVGGGSTTAYAWGFANFGIRVSYNGRQFLDTIIVAAEDSDAEPSASRTDALPIDIQITARTPVEVLLGRREVKSALGSANVYLSAAPDDTLKALWRDQILAGGEHPDWYGDESLSRGDFGPDLVVAVAADTAGHVDTDPRAYWDTGEPLLASTMEYCRRWDMRPAATRSGDTIVLDVTVPNTGSDRTSGARRVVFDREGGGLRSLKRLIDWETYGSVADVQARGKGDRQPHGYAKDDGLLARIGVAETGELHPSGNADDAEAQAQYLMASQQEAWLRYEVELTEGDGSRWGDDWDVNDKIVVYDSRRGVTLADYVVEATLSRSVPEPCEMAIKIGELDRNEDQQTQRSGGGGGGGGRKGGKPKAKSGEPLTWDRMTGSDATEVLADESQDELVWDDERELNIIYAESGATADPGGDGDPEEWELRVRARVFEGCNECNAHVYIRKPNGELAMLLAYDPTGGESDPGGGG